MTQVPKPGREVRQRSRGHSETEQPRSCNKELDQLTGFSPYGGDDGDRTHDLRLAKPALYQLSYIPGDFILPMMATASVKSRVAVAKPSRWSRDA